MSGSCGCCACLSGAGQTVDSFNRPGLSAIRYRAGTHSTFYDAMIRRLTVPVKPDPNDPTYSLHALTTREPDDPAIALLDAWACAADVLTFYQERIANESYLRTALERRSLLELGRLVGYTLKPGVAASVHLAYTLDEGAKTIIPVGTKSQSIPGANEQPQMFETSEEIEARGAWNTLRPRMRRPQNINVDALEFIEIDIEQRRKYRLVDNVLEIDSIWIDGTNTLFEKRDPLLFSFKGDLLGEPVYATRRVLKTVIDTELDRTRIVLEPIRPYYRQLLLSALSALKDSQTAIVTYRTASNPVPIPDVTPLNVAAAVKPVKVKKKKSVVAAAAFALNAPALEDLIRQILLGTSRSLLQARFVSPDPEFGSVLMANDLPTVAPPPTPGTFGSLFQPLIASRALAPRSQFQFSRSFADTFLGRSDANLRLLTAFHPELGNTVHAAIANVAVGRKPYNQFRRLFVLRKQASLFGYNAPDVPEKPIDKVPILAGVDEVDGVAYLDTPNERITVGSLAVIRNPNGAFVAEVLETEIVTRSAYGVSGRTSRLQLDVGWNAAKFQEPSREAGEKRLEALRANQIQVRATSLLIESEELTLGQQPVDRPVGRKNPADAIAESETRIEIDGVLDGLAPGRWVIARGERLIANTSGVFGAELAMIAAVEQETNVGAGGTPYSILVLANEGLAYEYKRSTVQILANVVPATNGESRAAILGSGSASTPLQTFTLPHTPLTFVPAPTVDGVRSTLAVRIDDALWRETKSLGDAGPNDRVYTTRTADDGKVTLTFGDGRRGRRIFSGSDNVRAVYRIGIGRGGNARAAQIATAVDRPLGVSGVVNPIEASGGADPESIHDARKNIPVSLQAMGRVVSVEDFANFARTFAGISKATAKLLSAAGIRFVHLTIGGSGDIPIDSRSDLYRNLVESLRKYGDPYQPFVVGIRGRIVITGAARVRVSSDHLWSLVAPKVRAALIETFSYDRREFGQPVFPAEVIAAIQNVPGVEYVDLDELKGVDEENVKLALGVTAPPAPSTGTGIFGGSGDFDFDFDPQNAIFSTGSGGVQPKLAVDCDGGRAILPRFARASEPVKPPAGQTPLPPPVPPPLPHESLPAEIAYLPPELADLFILTEIEHDRTC
jgi:hypothetical protein